MGIEARFAIFLVLWTSACIAQASVGAPFAVIFGPLLPWLLVSKRRARDHFHARVPREAAAAVIGFFVLLSLAILFFGSRGPTSKPSLPSGPWWAGLWVGIWLAGVLGGLGSALRTQREGDAS